jgi:hypothetical protein
VFVAWFTSKAFGGQGSTVDTSQSAQPDIEIDHHPDLLVNTKIIPAQGAEHRRSCPDDSRGCISSDCL